jgi:signal transduction histidine kinase/CheY-like chemotaxis protein
MSLACHEMTHPTRDHVVGFYDSEWYLCDAVGRFLRDGLEAGEALFVIATSRHRDTFERALAISGVDIQAAKQRGQLTTLDAEETLSRLMIGGLSTGTLDSEEGKRVIGALIEGGPSGGRFSGVRIYGEMVDLLSHRDNHAGAIQLEALWNELADTYSFRLYCAYLLGNFAHASDVVPFQAICKLHSQVFPLESFDELTSLKEQRSQIAVLQQRARALEAEVVERQRIEKTLRQRERELNEERQRLREIDRRKDQFLAMLGHELRNPLNPILTAIATMDARGDEASKKERDIIRRQAEHLAVLIEDLLDISRVTSGKVVLRKEPTELTSIVAQAVELADPLIQERAHLLEVVVPEEGLLIQADPVRLAQVIGNLLTNAAKYTDPGGYIAVSAERQDDQIVLEVHDNGIGIAPAMLPTIFEPFVQGESCPSLNRPQGGLGLGLALARNFTHLHGGSVSAHSDGLGKGSRFVVRLPALPASVSVDQPPRPRVVATKSHPSITPRRVLVVDDNADSALALSEFIRLLGHSTAVAHDGPHALAIAREFKPTVALLDIGLPGMDGYELAKQLREAALKEPLSLIAITGYGQASDRAKSREAGFDQHVVKPVIPGHIAALLEELPPKSTEPVGEHAERAPRGDS